ncbi:MAG TPA: hypothetical protein VMJ32_04175 [Pirellulales bacterium]|nr:hypothetical protein [Pirellulales bacterium]
MGVSHGHVDVGMARQLFSFWQRHAIAKQLRNMRVSTRRMEIGDPVSRFIRDAYPYQVLLDHDTRLAPFKPRE